MMNTKIRSTILCCLGAMVFLCCHICSATELVLAGIPSLFELDTVILVFSGDLDTTEVQRIDNYELSPTVAVLSANVSSNAENIVTLKLQQPLSPGMPTVKVKSGRDAQGNPIAPQSYQFHVLTVQNVCERIMSCQLPNGAINVYGPPTGGFKPTTSIRIVPYFSCQAALGLISGWNMTGSDAYLECVRSYLNWHEAHFNDDGTIYDYDGTVANPVSEETYDSTDSYGALYLMVLWRYYVATGDYGFISTRWDCIESAVAGMLLTLQDDELTWAKPTYKIKYTMDNSEVYQGCFAAAQLARVLGHADKYKAWLGQSDLTRGAMLKKLWGGTHYYYYLGDTTTTTAELYYPNGMATDMASVYIDTPDSSRLQASRNWVHENFMKNHIPASNVAFWSAWSAQRAGDDFDSGVLMVRCFENMYSSGFISSTAGLLLQLTSEHMKRPIAVLSHPVKNHLPDASTVTETSICTGHLWFHPLGFMVGANNRETYIYPSNSLDSDGMVLMGFGNCGRKLYVTVDAYDKYLTSAYDEIDCDGLSHFMIRDAVDADVLHRVGLTFSETSDMSIVTDPTPQGILASMLRENYSYALKPGNNTINNPADIDTGYTMELCVDLSSTLVGCYPATAPLDVVFGLRFADMDGTPFIPWPWTDGAEGTMLKLTSELVPVNGIVNVLRLVDLKPARCDFDIENME